MKKLFSLLLISFCSLSLFSQVVDETISWNLDIDSQDVSITPTLFDLERVQEEDEINTTFNGPWRFGCMR